MASEIKVDTVSEKTSANGVTIDGVNIKDSAVTSATNITLSGELDAATGDFSGAVDVAGTTTAVAITASGLITANADMLIGGTTPTLTIGDAGAEDAKIVFDGNAQDYHIGLDDSADTLVIGKGSALGTTTSMSFDANGIITKPLQPCFFVYKSGNQAGGSGTADIAFQTERFDLNADFSTPSFTAPVTGKYSFQAMVGHVNAQAGGNVSVYLQVSNAEIRAYRNDSDSGTSNYQSASISAVIDMDANDTCKLQFNSSSDDDFIIESATYRTYFSGYLVA